MNKIFKVSIIATGLLFSGCAHTDLSMENIKNNIGKIGGTAIGAGAGAAVGKHVGGDKGMLIGALLGGSLGYLIGNEIDERRKAITEIVKNNKGSEVIFDDITNSSGKKIGQSYIVSSEKSQFDSGKDILNSHSIGMFEDIAKQYAKSGMSVMIVGHTDADGSDEYNQILSEKRAKTIAKLFQSNGVSLDKIYYKGSGESEPIVRNNSNKEKAQNRRVEIVEVPNEDSIAQYAANKKINNALLPKENMPVANVANNNRSSKIGNTNNESLVKLNTINDKEIPIDMKGTKTSNNLSMTKPDKESSKEIPLDMKGSKVSEPLVAGNEIKKFNSQDAKGEKQATGVKGQYYTSQEKSKEAIGSCNNEYAYSKESNLDINGQATKGSENELLSHVGFPEQESAFSLVTPAVADDNILAYYGSCLNDKPRKSGDIKRLATGEIVLAKQNFEQAPLLNGSAWGAEVDNEFIMINPVGIKRSNMQSVSCPEVNAIKKGANQPWYGTTTEIVSYNGKDGLLYRIYPEDTSKIQCVDIAYPHGNPQDAKGIIYYKNKDGKLYLKKADFFSIDRQGGKL